MPLFRANARYYAFDDAAPLLSCCYAAICIVLRRNADAGARFAATPLLRH